MAALLNGTERQPNFATLNRWRHLYSAGRPSRWALAHILVHVYSGDVDADTATDTLHCPRDERQGVTELAQLYLVTGEVGCRLLLSASIAVRQGDTPPIFGPGETITDRVLPLDPAGVGAYLRPQNSPAICYVDPPTMETDGRLTAQLYSRGMGLLRCPGAQGQATSKENTG